MSSTLAFGSYIPGSSPIHAMNAQVKIILTCVFSIAVFLVDGWVGIGLLTAAVLAGYAIAQVNVGRAARGLIPVLFILVFTIVVHAFSLNLDAASAPGLSNAGSLGLEGRLYIAGSFGITLDGFVSGLFFALRIALLVALCSLLTFTTSMVALTDGMLRLLGPLRRLRVPIDDIAMMVSIALRFIPTTAAEARTVQLAQKARCADFDGGSIVARAKAWVPVLIPLFVRLFRRAEELAQAMDARCYAGGVRTHASSDALRVADIVAFTLCCAAIAVICVVF